MTDDELRNLARSERRAATTGIDAADDLAAVQNRIAAGELGTDDGPDSAEDHGRHWVWWLGAAAAFSGMVLAGVVTFSQDDARVLRTEVPEESLTTITSPTIPETTVLASTISETTMVETIASSSTLVGASAPSTTIEEQSATTLVAPTAPPGGTIAVDSAMPPPLVSPVPFASLQAAAVQNIAIGENFIALSRFNDKVVTLVPYGINSEVEIRSISLTEQLASPVLGPGDVIYGLGESKLQDGGPVPIFRYIAVALSGDRVGEVVAETELRPIYTELGSAEFGHGRLGIIDRIRMVNSTLISYVDAEGNPLVWTMPDPLLLVAEFETESNIRVSVEGSDVAWQLSVTRSPNNGEVYGPDSLVAPTSGGRAIYWESIGSAIDPDDEYSASRLSVIAILEPDGSGRWVRLPDDWTVAASDVWGTVLTRTTDGTIELALLDDALAVEDPGEATWPGWVESEISDNKWTLTAPGLNDFIADTKPVWASDPLAFGREIAPAGDEGEQVEITWHAETAELTVITSDFRDDSVFGHQWTVLLQFDADGLYRFVSGTWTNQCQPGRGQQDFRPELCT